MTLTKNLAALLLGAALLACGSGSDPGTAGDRKTYPTDHQGVHEGDILADLSFVLPDGTPFTFGDIYKDPKNRVLLLSTTAGWCSACREEQPRLESLYNQYKGRGLVVMGAIFEDNNSQPSTAQGAADWKKEYSLTFPFVADPDFQLKSYYDRSATPMNMVVDLDTMKILMIRTGYDEQAVTAVILKNLP